MTGLTGTEIEELSRSLSRALNRSDLEIYVYVSTGDQLYVEYVGEGLPLRKTIFQLLEELENAGTTHLFLAKVYSERSGRPDILELIERLCPRATEELASARADLSLQKAGQVDANASDNAFAPGLQRNVRPHLTMADMGIWIERLSEVKRQVCRVEINGSAAGTGFLVGPDTILTNWHVVERAVGSKQLDKVRCRFDYVMNSDASREDGTLVALHAEGCLDSSPYSPAEATPTPDTPPPEADELDYALLRLESAVGLNSVGGAPRGWVKLDENAPEPAKDQPILIVQHPDGAPMKLAMDTQAILGRNENGTRLRYSTNTESGSSGSPCFSMDWELVALHHFGDPAWSNPKFNQGVPIGRVRDRIIANGFAASLTE